MNDYNNDIIMNKILKFFILKNIIFNQIDNLYFQDLIYYIKTKILNLKINRKSIHEYLIKIELNIKEDLMITLMKNDSKINLVLNY